MIKPKTYFWFNKPSWIKLIAFDVVQASLYCTLLLKENQIKYWSPLPPKQMFALALAGSI